MSVAGRVRGIAACIVAALCVWGASSRVVAQSRHDEADLLIEEAREAMDDRAYDRAARLLDRAIELNPRRVDAYVLRASIYTIRKQYDRGVALMRRARSLAPDNPDVLNSLGTLLMLSGNADEAVPILEKVVAVQPRRYEAHALLGRHYARSGQWAKAESSLEAYLANRPKSLAKGDAVHEVDLADAKLRQGRADDALRIFRAVVDREPANVRAQMGLAWATAAIDCRKAMPVFDTIGVLGDKYPDVWLVWGYCALKVGKTSQALELSGRYTEVRPKAAGGYALLGDAQAASGDLGKARASLERAVTLEPDKHIYVLKLARLDRRAGEPKVAAARLSTGARPPDDDPLWEPWHVELAEALLADGRAGDAVEVLAPVVDKRAGSAIAHTVLGEGLLRSGNLPGAIDHLERAIVIDSEEKRPRTLLVECLNDAAMESFMAGDMEAAERFLVRAEPVADSARTWRNLGLVRIELGNAEAALGPLAKIEDPDAGTAHLYGHALALAGRMEDSERVLSRALGMARKDKVLGAAVALDLAATQLALNAPDRAVDTLAPFAKDGNERLVMAFVTASRAHATTELLGGRYGRGISALEAALAVVPKGDADLRTALECDLALAATGARQRSTALGVLRDLEKRKARCPFPAPADRLAVEIMMAINEGMETRRASRALKALGKLRKGATGAVADLIDDGISMIASRAAASAYARGSMTDTRKYLDEVRAVTKGRDDVLDHNLALIDLEAGRIDAAIAVFKRVAADVPEALVNLGIAYDRKEDPDNAVRYYRRAEANPKLKFPKVKEWIAAKENVYGPEIGR